MDRLPLNPISAAVAHPKHMVTIARITVRRRKRSEGGGGGGGGVGSEVSKIPMREKEASLSL